MTYYHVTMKRNLKQIMANGLVPKIGTRSKDIGEPDPAVFLFPSRDDLDNAMMNWLGEYFENLAENCLVHIELNLPTSAAIRRDAGFEVACLDVIPPENITGLFNEDWSIYKPR